MPPSNIKDIRNCNQTEILRVLRIDKRTLTKWVDNNCPTHLVEGKTCYDPAKILKWRVEYQKTLDQVDGDLAGPNTSDALERYRLAKAKQAEHDLDIKKEKYILKTEHVEVLNQAGDLVRQYFELLSKKVSVKVSRESDPSVCEKLLNKEINSILKKLALGE